MEQDIFCKIISGELEDAVFQDDEVVVLNDINPSAPVHLLVIPKKHFASLDEFTASDAPLLGKLLLTAQEVARKAGLATDGYRVIINTGMHGGQMVPHFHIHVLGGTKLNGHHGEVTKK